MTQDEIIRMAREAGAGLLHNDEWVIFGNEKLERFAALVAAHEREKQAEQSGGPVGVIGWAANIPNTMEEVHWEDECPPIGTTLYTTPVRTKDLTEDEIIDELNKRKFDWVAVRSTTYIIDSAEIKEFARAVIAADREKNK